MSPKRSLLKRILGSPLRESNTQFHSPSSHDQEKFANFLPPIPKSGGDSLAAPAQPVLSKGTPPPQHVLGPESKGNDMNFVVGLSENLLTECRRLNAENTKYKNKLKSALDEIQNFKEEVFQLRDLTKGHDKTTRENSELSNQLNNLNQANDKLELSNQSLSKSLHDLKASTQSEILALSERIESLNDENDQLHLRLAGADTTTQTNIETSKDVSKNWPLMRVLMLTRTPLSLIRS
ncbi:hypothetical protein Cantr_05707 [Candida viswanathii]|uniref:Autophagy-related protein 16 domain-containing protein n=1 Tax=Candida viswanathii TaxID=5486 RepID=A0A367XQ14_9ASCO|nr:hypothetical protein Cantr_05707 [Candida viswanathii]